MAAKTVEDLAIELASIKGGFKVASILGGVIGALILSFIGYTSFRTIPSEAKKAAEDQINDAVHKQIDTLVKEAIGTKFEEAGDAQIKRVEVATNSFLQLTKIGENDSRCVIQSTEIQFCWGNANLVSGSKPWTRNFNLTFATKFEKIPIVVPSIVTRSSTGPAGVIFDMNESESGFSGSVNDMFAEVPLVGTTQLRYVAIGRPIAK